MKFYVFHLATEFDTRSQGNHRGVTNLCLMLYIFIRLLCGTLFVFQYDSFYKIVLPQCNYLRRRQMEDGKREAAVSWE